MPEKVERNEALRRLWPRRTQVELAAMFGITQQRVQQILAACPRPEPERTAGYWECKRARNAAIRRLRPGLTQTVLAERFGIGQMQVSRIVRGH